MQDWRGVLGGVILMIGSLGLFASTASVTAGWISSAPISIRASEISVFAISLTLLAMEAYLLSSRSVLLQVALQIIGLVAFLNGAMGLLVILILDWSLILTWRIAPIITLLGAGIGSSLLLRYLVRRAK